MTGGRYAYLYDWRPISGGWRFRALRPEPLDASLPIYEDVPELHTARNQYVSFQIVLDAREEGKKNRKILLRMHRCLFERLNAPRCGIPPETFAPELEGAGKYIKVRSWEAFGEHFDPYLDGTTSRGRAVGPCAANACKACGVYSHFWRFKDISWGTRIFLHLILARKMRFKPKPFFAGPARRQRCHKFFSSICGYADGIRTTRI